MPQGSLNRMGYFKNLDMLRKKTGNTNDGILKKCSGHGSSQGHGLTVTDIHLSQIFLLLTFRSLTLTMASTYYRVIHLSSSISKN